MTCSALCIKRIQCTTVNPDVKLTGFLLEVLSEICLVYQFIVAIINILFWNNLYTQV